MDVKYLVTEWDAMNEGLASLRGSGNQNTFGGAFKELKKISELLQEAKNTIRKLDCDNDITFVHEDYGKKYDTLSDKFDTLGSFRAGNIVDETIDQPFFSDLDLFAGALHNAQIEKIGVPNLLGLVEPDLPEIFKPEDVLTVRQGEELPERKKKLVSLKDLFEAGDTFWGKKVKEEYEEYVKKNGDSKSLEMYTKENLLKSRDFEYKSIADNQELIELWADVGSLFGGGAVFALGDAQSAYTKKDWVSERDLTDEQAKGKLYMAILSAIPGVRLLKRVAKGSKATRATLNGSLKEARILKVDGSKIHKNAKIEKAKSVLESETFTKHLFSKPSWTEKFGLSKAVDELKTLIQKASKAEVSAAKGVKGKEGAKLKENGQHLNINKGDGAQPVPTPKVVQMKESQLKGVNLTDNKVHTTVKQQQAKTQHPSNKKGYNGNEVKEVEAPKVKEQYHQQTADGEQVRVDLNTPVAKKSEAKGKGGQSKEDLQAILDKKMEELAINQPPYTRKPIKPRGFKDRVRNEDGTTTYTFVNKKNNNEYKVTYDKSNYPIFKAKYETTLPTSKYLESDAVQFNYLSKELYKIIERDPILAKRFTNLEIAFLKEGRVPKSLTWHHHQEPGKMQIVKYFEHDSAPHTGGRAIWGGGQAGRKGEFKKDILEAIVWEK